MYVQQRERSPEPERSPARLLLRYSAAVVFVSLAYLVYPTLGLAPHQATFTLFLAAVALSAWYGGLGPGLLSLTLSTVIYLVLLFPPYFSFLVDDPSLQVRLIIFVFTGLLINGLSYARTVADERTQQERTWLQVTLASIGDGVIATDRSGRVIFMNMVAESLTGWTQVEAMGKDLREVFKIVNEETREPQQNPAYRVLREGQVVGLANHTVLIARDGTEHPIDDSAAPIRRGNADILGVLLVFRDVTDRRKAEQERTDLLARVQREQKHFEDILATVPGVVWESWGRPGDTQSMDFVSNYVQPMLGYSVEEWHSSPEFWLSIVHPDDREEAARAAQQALQQGSGANRFRWITKDGRVLHIESNSVTVRHVDGTPIGMRGVAMDISRRVSLEEQIRKQAEELRTEYERLAILVDTVDMGLAMVDADGRYLLANDAWLDQTGYHKEDLLGRRYDDFTGDEHLPDFVKLIGEVLNTGEPILGRESLVQSPQQPEGWYADFSIVPIRAEENAITGGLIAVLDVTEKVRAHQQLEEQRGVLETIVEGTPIGLALIDRHMRVISLNAEWARMVGTSVEQAKGRVLYDIHPSFEERRSVYEQVLTGTSRDLANVPYSMNGAKAEHYRDIHLRPVSGPGGEVTGMLNAVVDVTARHLLDKQKDEFIAVASHELKTPITTIKGYTQLTLRTARKIGDEAMIRALGIIDSRANRLTELINEMLDVSRIQSGTLPLTREEFDLSQLVKDVAAGTVLIAPNFTINTDVPPTPLMVNADHQRIEQVATNLMQNAVKYSGDSTTVDVQVALVGHEAVVSVRDYGVGIPADQMSGVFQRFFRASNVVYTNYSGLGLGLFISHSIIERHGGRMWVESEEGKGSTFHFALPVSAAD